MISPYFISPALAKLYRNVYYTTLIGASLIPVIIFVQLPLIFKFSSIAGVIIIAMACLVTSLRIYKETPGNLNTGLTLLGLCTIGGGAAFDIFATITHSPYLTTEANPIARLLLDNGISVEAVYMIGLAGQAVLVITAIVMWLTATKRYRQMIESASRDNLLATIKLLFGGTDRTLIDIILGKGDPFYLVTSLSFIMASMFLYRWYLGLEWFGFVPISRVVAPIIILTSSLIIYIGASHILYRIPGKSTNESK